MLLAATAWSNAATRCGATAFAVVHGAGTAHGLAVDRDHPGRPPTTWVRVHRVRPDHPVQPVGIKPGHGPRDRRLASTAPARDSRRALAGPDSSTLHSPIAAKDRAPVRTAAKTNRQGSPAAGGAPRDGPEGSVTDQSSANSCGRPGSCARTGMVGEDDIGGWLPRRGRLCENFHPSLSGQTRHSRHTAHHPAKPQVTASLNDFAEAVGTQQRLQGHAVYDV